MNFDEVHKLIPYVVEGELYAETTQVYNGVRVRQPGKHALDCDPIGGDGVVEVLCDQAKWDWKQFTHTDIFKDVQGKTDHDAEYMQVVVARELAEVVSGADIPKNYATYFSVYPGLHLLSFYQASQVLAVIEHRRYHKYEAGGGGRFLPLRFALGIIYGHWTASDASRVQRRGIHGLRELQKEFGSPPTVKKVLEVKLVPEMLTPPCY